MKASDYTPFFGLFSSVEKQITFEIEGKLIPVNDILQDYPDFELSEGHLDLLFYEDLFALQMALHDSYFTKKTVVPFLRELFDRWRETGNDPFVWLHATFQSVNLNPQNYRKDLISSIEKALVKWLKTFEKQPIDYLYLENNPENIQQMNNAIGPLEYLEQFKGEFRSNLDKENNCDPETIQKLYSLIVDLLSQLKPVRTDSIKTIEIIKKRLNTFDQIVSNHKELNLVINWLMKSIHDNDTYSYAFNFLVQYVNREEGCELYKLKTVSSTELLNLLNLENDSDLHQNNNVKKLPDIRVYHIALMYVYKDDIITRKNADKIAAEYGYTSKKSGEGLFQDYEYFKSNTNRRGRTYPFSRKKMLNKISRFEKVLDYLDGHAKQRAMEDIKALKDLYNEELE
ncbi:MAG: hypothetical protein KGZ82_08690 [Bacteroidales bacterium]|nr:hypothetical protein [Bacteroidales bacterium]